MKKLILTVVAVLIFFTTSFVFTFAMDLRYIDDLYNSSTSDDESFDFNENCKDTFEVISDICKYVCKYYRYDEKAGKKHCNWYSGMNIQELFYVDVNNIEGHRVGGSRQIASLLLSKLNEKGIEASLVRFVGKKVHFALMIELNGDMYILDLAHDKDSSKFLTKKFLIPLSEYCTTFKEYECVWVIKEHPENIEKRYSDLEPGVDYEIIECSAFLS